MVIETPEKKDSAIEPEDDSKKVKTDAEIYSKAIKLNKVENFSWGYEDQLQDM